MTAETRPAWAPRPRMEDGVRIGNVRLSNNQFGTLFTGEGATFNFGEEYKKGQVMHIPTFESVYLKSTTPSGATILCRYESNGSWQFVYETPDGKINHRSVEVDNLDLEDGLLETYSFTVTKGGISEILVVGWGDIPRTVVPMLPYHLLADEFDEKILQAA